LTKKNGESFHADWVVQTTLWSYALVATLDEISQAIPEFNRLHAE